MRTWTRKNSLGGPKLRSELDAHEAAVLRALVGSVLELLADRQASAPQDDLTALTGLRVGNTTAPSDPALARLLPDFHRPESGSPDAARANVNGALRSLHEPEIVDAKLAAGSVVLQTVPEHGGRVVLTKEQADAWLAALNDIRLALGAKLDVDPDTPDHLDPDDPRGAHLDVYHWLTWMQDSLLQAMVS